MKVAKRNIILSSIALLAASLIAVSMLNDGVPKAGYIDKAGNLQITMPGLSDGGEFKDGIAPVKVGENWGYIDETGKWIIPPQFAKAGNFSEGLACIFLKSKKSYAYIDRNARGVFEIEATAAGEFHDGIALIANGNRSGYIDSSAKFVIPQIYRFSAIRNSSMGVVPVQIFSEDPKFPETWIYVNHANKNVLSGTFAGAKEISQGMAAVLVRKETGQAKWGFLDHTGKDFAIAPEFLEAEPFSQGLAAIAISRRADGQLTYTYVDANNKRLNLELSRAMPFSEGLAAVSAEFSKNMKFGYIDQDGKYAIEPRFRQAGKFSEGLAFTTRAEFRPFWQKY